MLMPGCTEILGAVKAPPSAARNTPKVKASTIVDLVRPKADFDPETIAVLCAALDEAWDRLLQSESECTRPAYARAMREVVARRIIDMAQWGIRDQIELANGALRFLAANYRLERKHRRVSSGMAVAPLALPDITATDGEKSSNLPPATLKGPRPGCP